MINNDLNWLLSPFTPDVAVSTLCDALSHNAVTSRMLLSMPKTLQTTLSLWRTDTHHSDVHFKCSKLTLPWGTVTHAVTPRMLSRMPKMPPNHTVTMTNRHTTQWRPPQMLQNHTTVRHSHTRSDATYVAKNTWNAPKSHYRDAQCHTQWRHVCCQKYLKWSKITLPWRTMSHAMTSRTLPRMPQMLQNHTTMTNSHTRNDVTYVAKNAWNAPDHTTMTHSHRHRSLFIDTAHWPPYVHRDQSPSTDTIHCPAHYP